MITFLSKIFIKNQEDMPKSKLRGAYGMLCCIVGIFLNILLFAGKYAVGVISGSIAITADAFNNLSDAGSSVITLVGFRLAGKKPDLSHPFGHGRIEYLSGLAVSVIIIVVGIELFKSSVQKIITPEPVDTSIAAIIVLSVSILVKAYMFFYNRSIGKKIDSSGMKATAMDSISDTVATSVVLIATVVSYFTHVQIDGYCGILVALFILYTGITSAKDTVAPLLGAPPEKDFVEDIEKIVLSYEQIVGIHDLIVHDYGPGRVMISVHAEVDGKGNIYELHDAIDNAEHELSEKLNCTAVIHMDPVETDNTITSGMKRAVSDEVGKIGDGVSIHDFRMVPGDTHTNLIFDVVIPFEFKMSDDEVRDKINRIMDESFDNCFAVVNIDRPYT